MAIYLKLGNTNGIAAAEGHPGQIAVLLRTFALNLSREVTMEGDELRAGEWSAVATITKIADRGMMALLKEALAASQALFITMVPTRDRAQDTVSYKLSNCVLSDYDVSTHDTDGPIETIELRFSVMEDFLHYSSHRQNRQSAHRAL